MGYRGFRIQGFGMWFRVKIPVGIGATNTVLFWNFFWEASQAANYITGRPAIAVGDIVVMDNLSPVYTTLNFWYGTGAKCLKTF